jgi:glutathionylspermidine synthase
MRREARSPRPDWQAKVEHLGLTFHTFDGKPYWHEAAAYRFDTEEIAVLETSTNELHERCLEAVEHVLGKRQLRRLGIPDEAHGVITAAWDADPPAIYGRFDLAYDGAGPPKLLEYNADTPTSLLEAAVVQWHWLQEIDPAADQFNSIWEGLVEKWKALAEEGLFPSGLVHFGCMDEKEDLMTVAVLMDTAQEAGLKPCLMHMSEIGWDSIHREFVDPGWTPIKTLFKLYPWEWMLRDKFGPITLQHYADVQWIEPIWKMVLSNKGILAILWELFPGHPNLLPCYFDGPRELTEYVRKPLLGREGANVAIHQGEQVLTTGGPYEADGSIFQEYAPLPQFDGNHAVIGSWVIDGGARGIGVRESNSPITDDLARFVPHYFVPV